MNYILNVGMYLYLNIYVYMMNEDFYQNYKTRMINGS